MPSIMEAGSLDVVTQGACLRGRRRRDVHLEQPSWQVDAAVLKLHSRRCTCLEFHPTKVGAGMDEAR